MGKRRRGDSRWLQPGLDRERRESKSQSIFTFSSVNECVFRPKQSWWLLQQRKHRLQFWPYLIKSEWKIVLLLYFLTCIWHITRQNKIASKVPIWIQTQDFSGLGQDFDPLKMRVPQISFFGPKLQSATWLASPYPLPCLHLWRTGNHQDTKLVEETSLAHARKTLVRRCNAVFTKTEPVMSVSQLNFPCFHGNCTAVSWTADEMYRRLRGEDTGANPWATFWGIRWAMSQNHELEVALWGRRTLIKLLSKIPQILPQQ